MQAHLQSCPAARIPVPPGKPAAAKPAVAKPDSAEPSWLRNPGATRPSAHRRQSAAGAERQALERAGLAHDAANLMGAMGLYCDLLQQPGVLHVQHQHYADQLRRLVQRSRELLHEMLPVEGATTHGAHERQASPAATLRDLAPVLKQLAGLEIRFVLDLPEVRPQRLTDDGRHGVAGKPATGSLSAGTDPCIDDLRLDANALERITLNLVLNAVQALQRPRAGGERSVKDGEVAVSLQIADGDLCLRISDNGPGLPVSTIAALNSRGKPLGMSRSQGAYSGSRRGHGLRIVRELAAATGGLIAGRSLHGRGATIAVRWPLSSLQGCAAVSGRTGLQSLLPVRTAQSFEGSFHSC